jgi:hypothetical protein
MEQFDDMIRNSLAGDAPAERFEFKEEYWLQAQALLDNFERRQKRRRWWIWWSAGLLGAGALAYLAFSPASQNHVPSAPPETPMAVAPSENNIILQKNKAAGATIEPQIASIQQNPAESKNGHTKSKQEPVLPYVIGSLPPYEKLDPTFNSAAIRQAPPLVVGAPLSEKAENATAPVQDETTFYDTTSVSDPTEIPLFTPALTAPALLPGRVPPSVNRSAPFMPVAPLVQSSTIPPSESPISKVRSQRLNIGLAANMGTYSGYLYQEKPSFALGVAQRYTLWRRWSLNADFLWRRYSGNGLQGVEASGNLSQIDLYKLDHSPFSTISNQRSYSFGFTDQSTVETIRAIHWLEMPLSLQYRFGQIGVEAGGFAARMLTLGKQSQTYVSGSLQRTPVLQDSERATQKPEGVRRWETGYMAGLHWEPNRRWSVGARAYWRTSPEIEFRFASQASRLPFRNFATAEVRLRYFL